MLLSANCYAISPIMEAGKFQALCADDIYPYLSYFRKGHGRNNEPYRAYFLTFVLAVAFISIGELNMISIIITNFFLAAFAITNFACFDATQARSPDINWGSSTQANSYRNALLGLLKLMQMEEHVKNYRPQLLVLTGNPSARQDLVDFAYGIGKGQNLMICAHVVPYQTSVAATSCIKKLNTTFTQWFNEHKIKAFYCAVANRSLSKGVQSLLQTVGLGKMQPNIILMGFKTKWLKTCLADMGEISDYLGVIRDAFESQMSLCIFRNRNEGFDHSMSMMTSEDSSFLKLPDLMLSDSTSSLCEEFSRTQPETKPKRPTTPTGNLTHLRQSQSVENIRRLGGHRSTGFSQTFHMSLKDPTLKRQKRMTTKFTKRMKNGIIDVWWLYDDGGLTLLIPYLLTNQASYLEGANLRIFTITHDKLDCDREHENLVRLMKKFRIECSEVTVLCDDIEKQLYQETEDEYNEMISLLKSKKGIISDETIHMHEIRTRKLMRSRELLLEYSSQASLIVITLPLAHEDLVGNPLYLLWLELLSRDLPPTLFVRGNQTSVLTFYS
ncbi:unnamed protein product [Dracunculus medinensis]|uniref:SLC12 domain-containing protein n=1 Tax=Dracunculus medinensis TaxID=318479 RepID=A0A0N4U728_DRAME|nr:unnamed protein product [Dracunculus medinensis]